MAAVVALSLVTAEQALGGKSIAGRKKRMFFRILAAFNAGMSYSGATR